MRTLDEFPMHYAATQNNLGVAFRTLAEEEGKALNSNNAIKAYENALQVYTYRNFPVQFASTQNNIGLAYRTLAEAEDKLDSCRKGIKAFEEALSVFTEADHADTCEWVKSNLEDIMKFEMS